MMSSPPDGRSKLYSLDTGNAPSDGITEPAEVPRAQELNLADFSALPGSPIRRPDSESRSCSPRDVEPRERLEGLVPAAAKLNGVQSTTSFDHDQNGGVTTPLSGLEETHNTGPVDSGLPSAIVSVPDEEIFPHVPNRPSLGSQSVSRMSRAALPTFVTDGSDSLKETTKSNQSQSRDRSPRMVGPGTQGSGTQGIGSGGTQCSVPISTPAGDVCIDPKRSIADKFSLLNAPQAPPRSRARSVTSGAMSDISGLDGDDYNSDLWTAHQRVAAEVGKGTLLLPDSRFRRVWDCVHLACVFISMIIAPLVISNAIDFAVPYQIVHWFITLVYAADVFVRMGTVIINNDQVMKLPAHEIFKLNFRRWGLTDILSTAPLDCILKILPGVPLNVVKIGLALRFIRLHHVRSMFSMSNQGAIDPAYVRFYFDWVPRMKFFFSCILTLHILTCIKLWLADDSELTNDNKWDHRYDHCLFWIWNLLTTSPAPLTLNSYGQRAYCFFMMWCGVVFQGLIVGQVSVQLLQSSIHEQNKDKMRTTLDIVTHYALPAPLKQEVLSFQWHALQSNLNFLSNAGQVLERLPALMRNEVSLYAKIAFVNSIPMFQTARHETRVRLASSLHSAQKEPGENVITIGETGHNMFFILHGFCDVLVHIDGEDLQSVAVLKRGQFFGEVALLSAVPRTATVRTLTYCDFFILFRKDFETICSDDAAFRKHIADAMREKHKLGARNSFARGDSFGGERVPTGGSDVKNQVTRLGSEISFGSQSNTESREGSSYGQDSDSSHEEVNQRKHGRLVAELATKRTRQEQKESEAITLLLAKSKQRRVRRRNSQLGYRRNSLGRHEDGRTSPRGRSASPDGPHGPRKSGSPARNSRAGPRLPMATILTAKEMARKSLRSAAERDSPHTSPLQMPPGVSSGHQPESGRMGSLGCTPRQAGRAALQAMTMEDKMVFLIEQTQHVNSTVDGMASELASQRRQIQDLSYGMQFVNDIEQSVMDVQADVAQCMELNETILAQLVKVVQKTGAQEQQKSTLAPALNINHHGESFRIFANLF
eukprot:Hpha_TRINITY_DN13757_c0_g1::TRINITY_DN13757_c0_g1_i1::g.142798::m.142798